MKKLTAVIAALALAPMMASAFTLHNETNCECVFFFKNKQQSAPPSVTCSQVPAVMVYYGSDSGDWTITKLGQLAPAQNASVSLQSGHELDLSRYADFHMWNSDSSVYSAGQVVNVIQMKSEVGNVNKPWSPASITSVPNQSVDSSCHFHGMPLEPIETHS